MKKRVLIMSTRAGTGHVRAAEALTKAFKENPYVGEVIHSDALHFTNKLFRDFYSKLYARLVQTAPDFLLTLSSDIRSHGQPLDSILDCIPLVQRCSFRPERWESVRLSLWWSASEICATKRKLW